MFPSNTALLIVGLFLIVLLGMWNFYGRRPPSAMIPTPVATAAPIATPAASPTPVPTLVDTRLSGVIAQVDMSCLADGVCKILIDNIWIILINGGLRAPENQALAQGVILAADGITPASLDMLLVGKRVEVLANAIDANTMSIYGKSTYYVKLLN